MSLMRFYYNDPLAEFDRLFDDALATRVRPSGSADVGRTSTQRLDLFRPR